MRLNKVIALNQKATLPDMMFHSGCIAIFFHSFLVFLLADIISIRYTQSYPSCAVLSAAERVVPPIRVSMSSIDSY